MFFIRADGNDQIGSGHIMRCLSIAEALKDMGETTIFITADNESAKLIERKGFGYFILGTDYAKMEEELPVLLEVIKKYGIEKLLVDSYFVTPNYCKALNPYAKIFYMDDLGENILPVHTLINYNVYADAIGYASLYEKKVLEPPRLLLGSEYAPLRREFWNVEFEVQKQVRNVLITTGGSDLYNIAGKLLERILREESTTFRGIHFHVISGAYNTNADFLKKLERANLNFHVYESVTRMAELMQKCDIAVASCGSTIYELSAMGIPTVSFYFVHNQSKIAQSFGKELSINCGDYSKEPIGTIEQMIVGMKTYMESFAKRKECSQKLQKLVDGNGAGRLARILKAKDEKEGI